MHRHLESLGGRERGGAAAVDKHVGCRSFLALDLADGGVAAARGEDFLIGYRRNGGVVKLQEVVQARRADQRVVVPTRGPPDVDQHRGQLVLPRLLLLLRLRSLPFSRSLGWSLVGAARLQDLPDVVLVEEERVLELVVQLDAVGGVWVPGEALEVDEEDGGQRADERPPLRLPQLPVLALQSVRAGQLFALREPPQRRQQRAPSFLHLKRYVRKGFLAPRLVADLLTFDIGLDPSPEDLS
mmetsp:Transcript_16424/g.39416  ORF Transcript_16424/g.39416 Transcript_16424/m.39416 type:complete len:241 (+) Transcript_16424:320-1042(+)